VRMRLRPPEERFGAATLPSLLLRAASTGYGLHWPSNDPLPYAELAARAASAAGALREHGVRPGDRVCLLGSTGPDLVAALFGVWHAGAAAVLLPPPRRACEAGAHAEELLVRTRQADASALVVAPDQVPDRAAATVLTLPLCSAVAASDPHEVSPDDLALLQFTSGTTARSRAVALTHRQLLCNVSAFSDALGLGSADRGVSWLPLYHDMGILMVITAVAHPGDLLLAPTEDFVWRPGWWMDAVSRFGATVTVGPNQAYGLAARDLAMRPRDLDLSRLRVAGNGAEPVDARVLAEFAERGARYGLRPEALCPMYGLAEATLAVCAGSPGRRWREVWVSRERLESEHAVTLVEAQAPGARRLVTCGPPVPGVEVRIDGPGEVGEILVRSPSLMSGYWRDPSGTQRVLREGWLHTGDLGFLLDGELVVCGRAKDMIVVGGRNLYPEDYEQLVTAHTGVRRGNVIAFGLADVERMVVVAETAFAADRAGRLACDVMQMLTQELSHAPKEVIMVRPGTLPKTSSGKVQRGRCRDRYLAGELPAVASVSRR
jgi:fatty-acyl-CoA synthase